MENLLFGPMHLNLNERRNSPISHFNLDFMMTVLNPYLPRLSKTEAYTLILDMDETLIHYFLVLFLSLSIKTPSGGTFLVRPGTFQFIKHLASLYELVIFTAGTKEVHLIDK